MAKSDEILELLKSKGPLLPVEIASKLNMDSFMAAAYLSQMVEGGTVKASKERIGSTFLYYVAEHEESTARRVNELLNTSKKTARTFAKEVPSSPEVEKKRQDFATRLKEIEEREERDKGRKMQTTLTEKDKLDFLNRMKSAIFPTPAKPPVKVQIEPTIAPEITPVKLPAYEVVQNIPSAVVSPPPIRAPVKRKLVARKEVQSKIVDAALAYLVDVGANILGKDINKNGREADIVAVLPSAIGPMKMLVKAKSKKLINEADLAHAYTSGSHKKLPVLLIIDGKLSKNAQSYLEKISGLLKIRKV